VTGNVEVFAFEVVCVFSGGVLCGAKDIGDIGVFDENIMFFATHKVCDAFGLFGGSVYFVVVAVEVLVDDGFEVGKGKVFNVGFDDFDLLCDVFEDN
jgi:hypothetical protein